MYRKQVNSQMATSPSWFALSSTALGRDAVEAKDGYTILTLPAEAAGPSHGDASDPAEVPVVEGNPRKKGLQNFVCWEYIGASILT